MLHAIDHIGIAVHDLDAAIAFYRDVFGVAAWERIDVSQQHTAVAVAHVGPDLIELIAPLSPDAPFARYLAERGPGIHHVAYRVASIEAALAQLSAAGLRLIDETPRPGIHGTRVAFVHPRAALGTLIELVEHPAQSDTHA